LNNKLQLLQTIAKLIVQVHAWTYFFNCNKLYMQLPVHSSMQPWMYASVVFYL